MEINPKPAQAATPPDGQTTSTDPKSQAGAASGSGETPTDAAKTTPPTAEADKTTPKSEGKFKPLLKKLLPIVFIFIIVLAAGFTGYTLGKKSGSSEKATQVPAAEANAQGDVESTTSASVASSPTPAPPDCISGYKPYVSDLFSICYPLSMTPREVEEEASGSGTMVSIYSFSDDVETLKVNPDFKGNLNRFECATSKVVRVGGFSAQRYLIKDAGKTGGCGQTIATFATIVSSGANEPVFYISLTKKSGSYQSDNNSFTTIEQSFRINK